MNQRAQQLEAAIQSFEMSTRIPHFMRTGGLPEDIEALIQLVQMFDNARLELLDAVAIRKVA